MPSKPAHTATKQRKLPLIAAVGALAFAIPSAGLAVVSLGEGNPAIENAALDFFTPASVDPDLAARIAAKAREKGIRFTPAGSQPIQGERTVTVAVRIDSESAQAISVRSAIESVPSASENLAALQPSRYNLGTARGYKSFARPVELPDTVRDLSVPDLAEFEPTQPTRVDKPSRLQPRIALEDEQIAGRSENTLDSLGAQTVDVGGSFRLSPNLDVTAGVRLSQERDRLDPLTNSVQDSQAVYVGTQIRF
ncbi:MAG: hypothetical protein QNJ15_01245 [Erythrobacter sp.]|nr:hypothetical protein [Erythrobacter sp.]